MNGRVNIDLRDSQTMVRVLAGRQNQIESALAQVRLADEAGKVDDAPSLRALIVGVMEAQSVILMALASLHMARASASRIELPQIVVPGNGR